jgi:hypothetical protein
VKSTVKSGVKAVGNVVQKTVQQAKKIVNNAVQETKSACSTINNLGVNIPGHPCTVLNQVQKFIPQFGLVGIGDNHFGYWGFRDAKSHGFRDDGAMNVVVDNWRSQGRSPPHPNNGGTVGAGGLQEDCTSFDPVTASVQNIQGSWKVVTGNGIWMLDFGSGPNSQVNAQKAMGIIKQYKFTSQCFIGRPMPAMQYYLVSGGGSGSSNNNKAPSGTFAGQDCISFNPQTTTVQQIGASWKVVDGTHWIIDFGTSQANANKALSIIKKYDFSQICFVGRPNPPMMYFLSKS